MSSTYRVGNMGNLPSFDGTPEPPDSVFYPWSINRPLLKAAEPINWADALGGRVCVRTGMWVPAHRLKFFLGAPYLDSVCPLEHQVDDLYVPPGEPTQFPNAAADAAVQAEINQAQGPTPNSNPDYLSPTGNLPPFDPE